MANPRRTSRPSRPWSRDSPTANASPCVIPRSTIRTVRACAARAWIAAGSRPTIACATTPRVCGNARRCRRWARQSPKWAAARASRSPKIRAPRRSRPRWSVSDSTCRIRSPGITERNYRGTGLVVDAARGLVVVDRNTVPVSMGDVRVMFAGTLEIPGKVEFVHPLHNLAIVSYDPKLIGTTPVRSAKLLDRRIAPGEALWVVGMGAGQRAQHARDAGRGRCRRSSCRCRAPCSSAKAISRPSSS